MADLLHIGEFFTRISMGAILNSLWQGVALAAIAWVALRVVPRAHASVRYGLWCVALIAVLLLPVIAVYSLAVPPADSVQVSAPPPVGVPQHLAQLLLALWYLASTVLLARLIVSYVRLQQLKTDAKPVPLMYQHRVRSWLRMAGGRRECRLCISDKVPLPVAIGLIDPVIVLPSRLLEQLTDDELDQIGLHEVAHLQRWDDYTNVFQRVVEALLFFNPAVYLIGRQLTLEREIACDDRVVAATGKPLTYALCLTRLVEATALARQALPALSALSTRRQFAIRIERLLGKRRVVPIASAVAASVACAVMLLALVGAGRIAPLVGITPDSQQSEATTVASVGTPHVPMIIVVESRRAAAEPAVTAWVENASIARTDTDVPRAKNVARSNAVGARNFTHARVAEVAQVDVLVNGARRRQSFYLISPHSADALINNTSLKIHALHNALLAAQHAALAHGLHVYHTAMNAAARASQAATQAAQSAQAKANAQATAAAALSNTVTAQSNAAAARANAVAARANAVAARANAAAVRANAVAARANAAAARANTAAARAKVTEAQVEAELQRAEAAAAAAAKAATEGEPDDAPVVPAIPSTPGSDTPPAPPAPQTLETPQVPQVPHASNDSEPAPVAELAPGMVVAINVAPQITSRVAQRMVLIDKLAANLAAAHPRVIIIRALLRDPSMSVRLEAIRVLAPHADLEDVRAGLLRALQQCESMSVRVQVAVIEALAPYANDDPDVRASLEDIGGSSSEVVRMSVRRALSEQP